jgi:hypothetical protein
LIFPLIGNQNLFLSTESTESTENFVGLLLRQSNPIRLSNKPIKNFRAFSCGSWLKNPFWMGSMYDDYGRNS